MTIEVITLIICGVLDGMIPGRVTGIEVALGKADKNAKKGDLIKFLLASKVQLL